MRAIIIAGGEGKRLRPYTLEKPKCLLPFGKETILERQINMFRSFGIEDIVVLKWYKEEQINFEGIRYYIDPELQNMLFALFNAESELEGDVIISYGDIVYEKQILKALLSSKHDISVVVDKFWRKYYEMRFDDPLKEAESLILAEDMQILQIGAPHSSYEQIHGQFIGLIKLSDKGTKTFRVVYNSAKSRFWGKPWKYDHMFEKAFTTDLLQAIIDDGYGIYGVLIKNGWLEFDNVSDYQTDLDMLADGSIIEFFDISN